jgi:hypothetical protein
MPTLVKCKHGVYGATAPDLISPACSICTPPIPLTPAESAYMRLMAQPRIEYCEPDIIDQETE